MAPARTAATTLRISGLPPEQVARLTAAVGTAIDELGGAVTLPYATWGLTAIRADDAA